VQALTEAMARALVRTAPAAKRPAKKA
jgi:hypothetical protein